MSKRNEARPWGTLFGLGASCLATLAAVAAGIDPDVVLRRALYVGLTVSCVWTVGRLVFLAVLEASEK